jgi:transposase
MGKAYSQDLRERVIASVEGGVRTNACARLLRVSVSYVSNVMGRKRTTGEISARPLGRGPAPRLAGHEAQIRARVALEPDATLEELSAWLLAEHGVAISVSRLCRWLRKLGLTRKKRRSMPPSRRARMSPRRAPLGARHSPS